VAPLLPFLTDEWAASPTSLGGKGEKSDSEGEVLSISNRL